MYMKYYKLILFFALLWLFSILLIVKEIKFENKADKKTVFNQFQNGIKKEIRFRKSRFKAWQMLPSPHGFLSVNEKRSMLKNPEKPPGAMGEPVILNNDLKMNNRHKVKKGWEDHAFNSFVSELIPVNRTLPDVRDLWCKKRLYSSNLPQATVIICFHNEAWSTLLRTVHSVLNRSPGNLLQEVLLIDDASTMHHLKNSLEKYIKSLPKVKLIRIAHREGLIRARILGTKNAEAPVVVFLDSHCECVPGWLEPLLERVSEDPTKVVSPVIDDIHASTFEYIHQDVQDLQIGGFTWNLKYIWIPKAHETNAERNHDADPVKTPTISGGLFAIDKKYFETLGFYDDEFDIWGAENLELSFKTWMCGGSVEIIPCSHVGHVFRSRVPYKGIKGSNIRNNVRLAEVWLDDYAKYFYERIGNNKGEFGDVTERKMLRKELNCKSFKWYLNNVYPQMIIPDNYVASGQITSLTNGHWCLDSSTSRHSLSVTVVLLPCHHNGGNQYWIYTKIGEIQRDNLCLDFVFGFVVLYICRGKGASQTWFYDEKAVALGFGYFFAFENKFVICGGGADNDAKNTEDIQNKTHADSHVPYYEYNEVQENRSSYFTKLRRVCLKSKMDHGQLQTGKTFCFCTKE